MIPPPQTPQPPKRPYSIWTALLGLFLACGLPVMIGVQVYRSVTGVRHDIQGPACKRHLSEILRATAKFSLAHAGRLPGKDWMSDLRPYVENEAVFFCPLAGDEKKGFYGFAMNEAFVGASMVSVPDDVPLFFDSTLPGRSAVGSLMTLPKPGRHLELNPDVTRDREKNNVGFVSGGVSATETRYE